MADVEILTPLTLNVGSDPAYPTFQAAYDHLKNKWVQDNETAIIKIHGHVSISSGDQIGKITHPCSRRIRLVGNSGPLVQTVQATGHSVGGSEGAYEVILRLDSVSGVAVNDVIALGATPPVGQTQEGTENPSNDLFWGFAKAASDVGKMSASGTQITFSGGDGISKFPADDLMLIYRGEIRAGVRNTPQNRIDLSEAFSENFSDAIYWYWVRSASGTISSSGGASNVIVTGSGTNFNSRVSVGDLLVAKDCIARVTEVTNDTQLKVNVAPAINSGSKFGIVAMHRLHRGAFVITAVNSVANTVTYTNRHRASATWAAPTGKQITGGKCKIYKNSLRTSVAAGEGLVFSSALALIDDLAFVGSGESAATPTGTCFDFDDGAAFSEASLALGPNVALTEWGNGIIGTYCNVHADGLVVGNIRAVYGAFIREGALRANGAVFGQSPRYGVWCGEGSRVYLSLSEAVGCFDYGFYRLAANFYADGARTYCCGSSATGGRFATTGGGSHDVQGWDVISRGNGSGWQRGAGGRAAGCLSLGNAETGLAVTDAIMGAEFALSAGNGDDGILVSAGDFNSDNIGVVNNVGRGVYGVLASRVAIADSVALANRGRGFQATSGCRMNVPSSLALGNSTDDYSADGYGSVMIVDSPVSSSSDFNQTRNKPIAGAIILDSGLGAVLTIRPLKVAFTWEDPVIGTVISGAEVTKQVAVLGVVSRDDISIGRPLLFSDFLIWGVNTNTNEVTVYLRNIGTVARTVNTAQNFYIYVNQPA